ncbi:hypothetical protein HDU98_008036 [Podochytrium sp. JEL0797]|nr:hypothetical protein HDU98_008036 [Podochytrium sp. JEL0797]
MEDDPPSLHALTLALTCPISYEIFQDPVCTMDGHTYERAHVLKWLANRPTSPKTGADLDSTHLIPNYAIKSTLESMASVNSLVKELQVANARLEMQVQVCESRDTEQTEQLEVAHAQAEELSLKREGLEVENALLAGIVDTMGRENEAWEDWATSAQLETLWKHLNAAATELDQRKCRHRHSPVNKLHSIAHTPHKTASDSSDSESTSSTTPPLQIDVSTIFNLSETYLKDHNLLPPELVQYRAELHSRTLKIEAAVQKAHRDKHQIAYNIALFKDAAWKETDEVVDLTTLAQDVDEEILKLLVGRDVRLVREQIRIETRIKEEEKDMHGSFMKIVKGCVSRPRSAAVVVMAPAEGPLARPDSAVQSSRPKSGASVRTTVGAMTVSSLAKVKTRHTLKKNSEVGGRVVPIDGMIPKQRPHSAPGSKSEAQKASLESKQVQLYFKKKLESETTSIDKQHYKLLTLDQTPIEVSPKETSTVDAFMKSYSATAPPIQDTASSTDTLNGAPSDERASQSEQAVFIRSLAKQSFNRTGHDISVIFNVARNLAAFKKIGDSLLMALCKVMKYTKLNTDRAVFKQGNHADNFFIRHMAHGDGFGDIALTSDKPRSATVITTEPTELFRVEKVKLEVYLPLALRKFDTAFIIRTQQEDYNLIVKSSKEQETLLVFNFFKKMLIFDTWNQSSILNVAQKSSIETFTEGDIVTECGEMMFALGVIEKPTFAYIYFLKITTLDQPIRSIYFIKSGVFSVVKYFISSSGTRIPVVTDVLRSKRYFGEESVLSELEEEIVKTSSTIVAGNLRNLTGVQLQHVLTATAAHKGSGFDSGNVRTKVRHHATKCELVSMSAYEAKSSIRTIVRYSPWTVASNEEILKFYWNAKELKRWRKMREKEVNMLVKEKYVDPNASMAKLRASATRPTVFWR